MESHNQILRQLKLDRLLQMDRQQQMAHRLLMIIKHQE
jgi:hypothetical protein